MITLNIKPVKYAAKTKQDLMRQIRNDCTRTYLSNSYFVGGSGILFTHNGMRRLYNVHKVNKKTIQHKYKSGLKKGQTKKIEVIAPAQWIAYVYTFTKDQFELFGNTPIKQGPRNFVIGSKVVSYKK